MSTWKINVHYEHCNIGKNAHFCRPLKINCHWELKLFNNVFYNIIDIPIIDFSTTKKMSTLFTLTQFMLTLSTYVFKKAVVTLEI